MIKVWDVKFSPCRRFFIETNCYLYKICSYQHIVIWTFWHNIIGYEEGSRFSPCCFVSNCLYDYG